MSRKRGLRIGRPPAPVAGRVYPLRVHKVLWDSDTVLVELRHTGKEMEGIRHEVVRDVPVNPAGIVGDLLRACGLEVPEDSVIDPSRAIGRTVHARFETSAAGALEIAAFEPLSQEKTRDTQPEAP